MPGLLSAAVASALINKSKIPTSNTSNTNITVKCSGTTSSLTQYVSLSYWSESDTTDYVNNIPSVVGLATVTYSAGCLGYIGAKFDSLVSYGIALPNTVYTLINVKSQTPMMYSSVGDATVVTTRSSELTFSVLDYMFHKHMSNSFSVKLPQADDTGRSTFTASFGYQVNEFTGYIDGRYNIYYRLAVDGISAGTPYISALVWNTTDNEYLLITHQILPDMINQMYIPGSGLSITGLNLTIVNTSSSAKTFSPIAVLLLNTHPYTNDAWKNKDNVLMGILFTGGLPKYTLQPNSRVSIANNLTITPSGVYLI